MPHYRRFNIEGGIFFFTVTLADRTSDILTRRIDRLRDIYRSVQQQRPFESIAIWPAPGSEDTELGVLMGTEVRHGEAEVYARVQA